MGEISILRLIVVAFAGLAAGTVWFFRTTGDPDSAHKKPDLWSERKPRSRYAELVAARREVERRMDDLRFSRGYRGDVSGLRDETMEQLRAIHAEIEAQLEALRSAPQA
ncbi:MAG TPA: hypothetical protein VN723_02640 [Rhizomicrobium sp.]|jgi:hypothetical protein|nr:hypothetical protein [Rhizomicrobium sp.]